MSIITACMLHFGKPQIEKYRYEKTEQAKQG